MSNLEQFKLHPSVIYNIIREQSGTPEKAIAELVMNSIDAGAKNIHLDLSSENFSIKDDGLGFGGVEEIEAFFGTFGTPHQKGDATYGQFRLGRGQAFSLAKTEWRSGNFGMTVDLACVGKEDTHGYHLHEFGKMVEGCEIKGDFYESLHLMCGVQSKHVFNLILKSEVEKFINKPSFSIFHGDSFVCRLLASLCLIRNVNVYLNGTLVSGVLCDQGQLIHESDTAAYYYTKSAKGGIVLLNQGIYIAQIGFKMPMVIDFKTSPNLNIARNQINAECPIYIKGRSELYSVIFSAWLAKKQWSKQVGALIASSFYFHLGQFDREFVCSLNEDDRIAFAKHYKVNVLDFNTVTEVSLWDALDIANKEPVCFNNESQNYELKAKHLPLILEKMNLHAQYFKSKNVSKLIIDLNSAVVKEVLRGGMEGQLYCSKWFGKYFENVQAVAHGCFSYTHELRSDTLVAPKVNSNSSNSRKNESQKIYSALSAAGLNISASTSWLNKNDQARQVLEDGIAQFKTILVDMIEDCCGEVPEMNELGLERNVKPLLVNKLHNSSVGNKIQKLDDEAYLIITVEDFAQGGWMDTYLKYLLVSSTDEIDELVYEHASFNEKFHDNIGGDELSVLFSNLQEVALQASGLLHKKPMRLNRKASMAAIKSAWGEILNDFDGIAEDKQLAAAWSSFNEILI